MIYLLWGTMTQSKLKKSILGGTVRTEKELLMEFSTPVLIQYRLSHISVIRIGLECL